MPKANVFIGSTKEDLLEHRAAVRDAVLNLDCHPEMMEYWPAMDAKAVKACMDKVDACEIYIGIYAHRYGYCPEDSDISITEMEFNRATEKNKIRLCFLVEPKHPWTPDFIEEEPGKSKLKAFKSRLDKSLVRGTFTDPRDLANKVTAALGTALGQLPLPTVYKPNCNLVPQVEHFAGRAKELEALQAALTGSESSVAITAAIQGSGGIGKSTLARYFAHNNGGAFPMALWGRLGERADEQMEGRILREWAQALAGQTFPPDVQPDDLRAAVRGIVQTAARDVCGEPVLLVIDDVWQDTLGIARKLRDTVPDACLLVTTRSNSIRVALGCKPLPLPKMQPDEGAALMIDLIGEAARAHEALLRRLSAALDGYPLALTLAARRAGQELSEEWLNQVIAEYDAGMKRGDDFGDLELDAGEDKEDSVSVTLRSTLDAVGRRAKGSAAANDERNAKRQAQFRALGALPPDLPLRRKHIYALWGEEDAECIADLLAEGLLQADPQKRKDWYSQHRLLRAYARALLREAGEFEDVTTRHRNYLITLADEGFERPPETWGELDDDLPQIHALGNELAAALSETDDEAEQDERLRALSERGETDADEALLGTCSDFGYAISEYVWGRYIGAEGRRWLWAALAAVRARGQQERVGLFTSQLGSWHNQRGDKRAASAYHGQSLDAAREIGDKRNEAAALTNLGAVYDALGEKQKALDYYEQALPLLREVGYKRGEAAALNNLGMVYHALGEPQQALDYYRQALPLLREVGEKRGVATTINNLGGVYDALGEKQKALDYYAQALLLYQQVDDKGGVAMSLNNLGEVYRVLSKLQQALDYYGQALPLLREVGNKGGEAGTLNNLGLVYDALGEKQKALDCYRQALPLRQQVGDKGGEATTLNNIGLVYSDLGEQQKALDSYGLALPLYQQVGDKGGEATTLNNIGVVYSDLGEQQKALDYYGQALPLVQQVGDKGGEAATLNNLGLVYSDLGEKQKALDSYGLALPLYQQVGDKRGEAATLNNLGLVYSDLGEKQKALDSYGQALPLVQQVGDIYGEAITRYNMAVILWGQGEREAALAHMQAARKLNARMGISTAWEDELLAKWRGEMGLDGG